MIKNRMEIRKLQVLASTLTIVVLLFTLHFSMFTGSAKAAFEELITTGARAQGMGEAFCGVSGDVSGMLINPACIGTLDKMSASFTGSFPFLGQLENESLLMNSYGVFSTPIMKGHTVGGGVNYFSASKYNELAVFGTYAYQLFDNLTIAGTLKYLSWKSAESQFYTAGSLDMEDDLGWGGISVDAGAFYKPAKDVGFGFALTDINQPNIVTVNAVHQAGTCTDLLPIGIRAGMSFSVYDFLVAFDYDYHYNSYYIKTSSNICLGIERDLKEFTGLPITVRGGATFLDLTEGMNFSAGASFGENRDKSEIAKLIEDDIDAQKSKLRKLEDEQEKLQGQADEMAEQLKSAPAEEKPPVNLKAESSQIKSKITALSKSIAALEKKEADAKKQEEARIAKEASLHEKTQSEIQTKKDELEKLNAEKEQISQQLEAADKKAKPALASKLAQAKSKTLSLSRSITSLKKKEQDAKKLEEARIKKEEDLHQSASNTLQAKRAELEKLQGQADEMAEQLKSAPAEEKPPVNLKAESSQIKSKITALSKSIAALEKKEADAKKQEEARIAKEASLHEKTQSEIQTKKDELEKLNAEKEQISQQLEAADKKAKPALASKLAQAKSKTLSLSQSITSLEKKEQDAKKLEEARIKKEEDLRQSASNTLQAKRAELEKLEAEKEQMEPTLKAKETRKSLKSTMAKISQLKPRISSLSQSIVSSEKALERSRNEEPFRYRIDYAMNILMIDAPLLTHKFSFGADFDTFDVLAKKAEEEKARKAEEARLKKEEEERQKAELEAKRQALAEEKKQKEEAEAQRLLEEKAKKEQEEKQKAQEAGNLILEAEKLVKQAELQTSTQEAEKLKAEAAKKKQEAALATADAEKARTEAAALADREQQEKLAAEAKSAELKTKFESLAKERPKDVVIRDSARGVSAGTLFATGRSTLNPKSLPILDKLAEELAEVLGTTSENISVEGHTDSIGSRDANVKLSTARAEAVAKILIDKGIARERITTTGYGPDRPAASNATKEGREQNRRVEIILLK